MITMADPDDTMGQGFVRIDGKYFAEALRACGGMAELMLNNAYSPMLFTTDGYKLVVMPMLTDKANQQAKDDREAAKAEAEPTEPAESQPVTAEPEANKPKAKRSRAKQPVTA
jgi:DNA polymerase-3 subunit beta